MSLAIDRAAPADLAECAALYDRVARETFTWLPVEDSAAKFLAEAAEEEVYVARIAGRIVGLASLYRPASFLHSLYVEAGARGRGVGSALFAHVQAVADGLVSLKVQKLNTGAIAFYRARGAGGGGARRPRRPRRRLVQDGAGAMDGAVALTLPTAHPRESGDPGFFLCLDRRS